MKTTTNIQEIQGLNFLCSIFYMCSCYTTAPYMSIVHSFQHVYEQLSKNIQQESLTCPKTVPNMLPKPSQHVPKPDLRPSQNVPKAYPLTSPNVPKLSGNLFPKICVSAFWPLGEGIATFRPQTWILYTSMDSNDNNIAAAGGGRSGVAYFFNIRFLR